jgi:hypothetical protein
MEFCYQSYRAVEQDSSQDHGGSGGLRELQAFSPIDAASPGLDVPMGQTA